MHAARIYLLSPYRALINIGTLFLDSASYRTRLVTGETLAWRTSEVPPPRKKRGKKPKPISVFFSITNLHYISKLSF